MTPQSFEDLIASLQQQQVPAVNPMDRILAAAPPTPAPVPPKQQLMRKLSAMAPAMTGRAPMQVSRPPETTDTKALKSTLQQVLERQQSTADEFENRAKALENSPDEMDLRPLAAVVDMWTGSHTSDSPLVQNQLTKKDKIALATALREKGSMALDRAGDTQAKMLTNTNTTDAALTRAALMATLTGNRQVANNEARGGKEIDGMTKDLGKDLDSYSKARTVSGRIAGTKTDIQRARALVDSVPGGNLTGTQMQELGESMAKAISGSGVTSNERVMSLVPQSARGKAEDIASWFTNEPRGRGQQAFVKMFMDTLDREEQLANSQLKDIRMKKLPSHRSLWEQNPERVLSLATAYGMTPDEVKDAFIFDPNKAPQKEVGDAFAAPGGAPMKPKAMFSASRNKTKVVHPDGREEILDGDQRAKFR
jgi:hypothetical protein